MTRKMKIAAIQMDCTPMPTDERLKIAAQLLEAAADTDIAVFPELFNTGYEYHERNYRLAEPVDGQTVTWMKAKAAQHNIHLAGTLLLRDGQDSFNAAILVAPDGRHWRYDKQYVPFWERAYFRNGNHITIADTAIGRLGMMICWDQSHPDLWEQYAGQVDVMIVMSCPGDLGTGELVFPDGFRTGFLDLVGRPTEAPAVEPESDSYHKHAAWMGVPLVESSATGKIRTRLPMIKSSFPGSPLEARAHQAAEMFLECGFPAATQIVNHNGEVVARGSNTGNAIVVAEIKLPDTLGYPRLPQPPMNITPEMYQLSDEVIPAMMVPLYNAGIIKSTT